MNSLGLGWRLLSVVRAENLGPAGNSGGKYVSEYGQIQIIIHRITVKLSERELLIFFPFLFFFPPHKKSLCLIEIPLQQEAGYLQSPLAKAPVGTEGAGCSVKAGAGFRAVRGPSALPGAAAARPGARGSPWLLLCNRGAVSFPCPLALGSLGWRRTRCLYLLGAKISLVSKESLTTHLCKSPSNAAPPLARAAGSLRQTWCY